MTSKGSKCVQFCFKHHLFVKGLDKDKQSQTHLETTHIFMDGIGGGSIHVPWNLHDSFMECFIEDIVQHQSVFLLEKCTPHFKFFVDIDYIGLKALDQYTQIRLGKHIQTEISKYYVSSSPKESSFLICSREPVSKKGTISTGVHIIFPFLIVNTERALQLHASILQSLCKYENELETSESWNAMADKSVYLRGHGDLRMLGSRKTESCPTCSGLKDRLLRLRCKTCQTLGKVDIGRAYFPTCYMIHEQPEKLPSLGNCILLSSLRTENAKLTEPYLKYDNAPEVCLKNPQQQQQNIIHYKSPLIQEMQNFIRKTSICPWRPKVYSQLEIAEIRNDGYSYTVKVHGPGSDFCMSKEQKCPENPCHHSSIIYFHIDKYGLSQRCFSQKTDACRYFDLPQRISLPQHLQDQLFPKVKLDKHVKSLRTLVSCVNTQDQDGWDF